MSHTLKISSLTDELVQSILQFDPASNRQAYRHAKEIALRGLRTHQYARTNQFDVANSLAGLDEKFRVKNRDDLADALQLRLKKLEGITLKFKPEFLSLLLHLSDRPLENTELKALDLLRAPSPPAPLTWRDILENDPYSDEEIWKDIDYGGNSSGDEKPIKKRPVQQSSPPTSIEAQDDPDPESSILASNLDVVAELQVSQFWRHAADEKNSNCNITELQAVRETLFMLAGVPTSLYQLDKEQSTIRQRSRYKLSHGSNQTMEHLFSQFAAIGQQVYGLRKWAQSSSSVPLVQTFEAAVQERLLSYDQSLAQLQDRYLRPSKPIVVSLIQLHHDIRAISKHIIRLAQIVSSVEPKIPLDPFSPLEALFEEIVLSQMILETKMFKFMSGIFFDCLQTYLRPIRAWMETGELAAGDETFFVFESNADSDLGSTWHDRYALRKDAQGKLRMPSFLQPAVKKIFNTGKSIGFLEELGVRMAIKKSSQQEPRLDYLSVCGSLEDVPFEPFPGLFEAAFERWMQSKYSHASSILRQHIFEGAGLMRVLDNFEMLYMSKNGAVFENFANTLFERMDAGRTGWSDRYALTEIARDVFSGSIARSEAENLIVRSHKPKTDGPSTKTLESISFDFAISWPLQNIIRRSTISIYQQLFTFLLLVYRTKYLLQRSRPGRSSHSASKLTLRTFHRLTWFTDIIRSYLTEHAVYFTTCEMNTAMSAAEDLDEMADVHSSYMLKLKARALLSKELKLIYEAVVEILDLGVDLAMVTNCERSGNNTTKPEQASKARQRYQKAASDDSESDALDDQEKPAPKSRARSLQNINIDFKKLLPFVTAGLRSVGRAGAEPMWEQLAHRLEWTERKEDTPKIF